MPKTSGALWAVEVERDGDQPPEYYSIESLLVDDTGLHFKVAGSTSIELKRSGVRKIMIMRTTEE